MVRDGRLDRATMTNAPELPSLELLESFGWIFTPGPLPAGAVSSADALKAAGISPDNSPSDSIAVQSGSYTEKGRYRQAVGGRRDTLYREQPVWVVTIMPPASTQASIDPPEAERLARHILVDARTGTCITQFLLSGGSATPHVLDLHAPLSVASMSRDQAVAAALAGEERVLTDLDRTAEYGSRWRLIPGFVQVTDVWHVAFDTSSLPPVPPEAPAEVAWVVVVDDKAGHRWLSAAVEAPPAATG